MTVFLKITNMRNYLKREKLLEKYLSKSPSKKLRSIKGEFLFTQSALKSNRNAIFCSTFLSYIFNFHHFHFQVLKEVNSVLSLVEVTSSSTDNLRQEAEKAEEAASSLNKTFADQLTSIASQKALTYKYLDDVSQLLKAIDSFQMPNFTKDDIQSKTQKNVLQKKTSVLFKDTFQKRLCKCDNQMPKLLLKIQANVLEEPKRRIR